MLIRQAFDLNKFLCSPYFSSLIDQFFGGTFDIEMKCTESEDETPTFTQENFLQLSCFISQEVKYMLSGIKSVRTSFYLNSFKRSKSRFTYSQPLNPIEIARAADKKIANFGQRCRLCSNRKNDTILLVPYKKYAHFNLLRELFVLWM